METRFINRFVNCDSSLGDFRDSFPLIYSPFVPLILTRCNTTMHADDYVLFISLLLLDFSWKEFLFFLVKIFIFFFFIQLRFMFLEDIYEIFMIDVVFSFIYKSYYLTCGLFSMNF